MKRARLRDVEYRALAEFRHRLRSFLAFSEAEARAAGLNPQHHQLLLALRALMPETPTIRTLAEQLVLKHHSTVELTDRLEARGLVRRGRALDDRRRVSVQLTKAGADVLDRLSFAHREELLRAGPALVQSLLTVLEPRRAKSPRRTQETR